MNKKTDEILYKVYLDRGNLDVLMQHLSECGQVDTTIDEYGVASFDIPKDSNIDIETINIFEYIEKDLDRLKEDYEAERVTIDEFEIRRSFLISMTGYFEDKFDEKYSRDMEKLEQQNAKDKEDQNDEEIPDGD